MAIAISKSFFNWWFTPLDIIPLKFRQRIWQLAQKSFTLDGIRSSVRSSMMEVGEAFAVLTTREPQPA
jgi:hypothetical protein